MALISSGFMLLPYAGILPLPLLIASLKSSSLIFFTSSEAKSFTFRALPVAVSPLPSTPWHAAHLALYSFSLASSAREAMVTPRSAARTEAPITTPGLIPLFDIISSILFPPNLLPLTRVASKRVAQCQRGPKHEKDHQFFLRCRLQTVLLPRNADRDKLLCWSHEAQDPLKAV